MYQVRLGEIFEVLIKDTGTNLDCAYRISVGLVHIWAFWYYVTGRVVLRTYKSKDLFKEAQDNTVRAFTIFQLKPFSLSCFAGSSQWPYDPQQPDIN